MAKELKDLQQLIAEKAEKRFNQDYSNQTKAIKGSQLFNDMENPITFEVAEGKTLKAQWAFDNDYAFYRKIKAHWLPIYISQETEMFMSDVERIKSDVDDLMNGRTNQYDDV